MTYQLSVPEENIEKLLKRVFPSFLSVISSQKLEGGVINPIIRIQFQEIDHHRTVILKVGNPKWKRTKTLNEVNVLLFLKKHTTIPVPTIYAFDVTTHNEIQHEFIVMEYIHGVMLNTLLDTLTKIEKEAVAKQVAEILFQLRQFKKWNINEGTTVFGGSFEMLEYDAAKEQVNATIIPDCDLQLGPFHSLKENLDAVMERRYQEIQLRAQHFVKYIAPFQRFQRKHIQQGEPVMEGIELCLTHSDFHPGNIIIDPETKQIAAVLDWEWATYGVSDVEFQEVEGWLFEDFSSVCSLLKEKEKITIPSTNYKNRKFLFRALGFVISMACCHRWFDNEQELKTFSDNLEEDAEQFLREYNIWE